MIRLLTPADEPLLREMLYQAIRLYRRLGFVDVGQPGPSLTLALRFTPGAGG